jgi:hypothetical protein
MSISELGSLGEFISSIAVVVTLLFLGLQVRQSNALARRNEMNAGHQQISNLRLAVATHGELAEILIDGVAADTPLGAVEQARFDNVMSEMSWSAFHIWDRARMGLLPEDEWARSAGGFQVILASPGGLAWWVNNKQQFQKDFQRAIEESR